MPSASLQSRISVFESLSSAATAVPPRPPPAHSPSPSPPNLGRKTSLIDLKDWIVTDSPPSRTGSLKSRPGDGLNGYKPYTPTQKTFNAKKVSPAPLINLESPPSVKTKPPHTASPKAPALPPRKPSLASLRSAASTSSVISSNSAKENATLHPPPRSDSLTVEHTYPPSKHDANSRSKNGHAPASSISSFHSVSLSSDNESAPGSLSNFIATFPADQSHNGSTSSSVETDSISLAESYEEVSSTSVASPATERMISLDWERALAKSRKVPPKLPDRPSSSSSVPLYKPRPPPVPPPPRFSRHSSSTPSSPKPGPALSPKTSLLRRVPPPPPPPSSHASDRSSVLSSHSIGSASSFRSPSSLAFGPISLPKSRRSAPAPPAARKRYEVVFNANIVQWRRVEKAKWKDKPALLSSMEAKRTRQAAGWRGLSVDLITAGDDASFVLAPAASEVDSDVDQNVGSEERLPGAVVRAIWTRSKLDKGKLREIWNECDPDKTGSLDRDGFVKGMWKIDEELRRAHLHGFRSASAPNLGASRPRPAPTRKKSKPILT